MKEEVRERERGGSKLRMERVKRRKEVGYKRKEESGVKIERRRLRSEVRE